MLAASATAHGVPATSSAVTRTCACPTASDQTVGMARIPRAIQTSERRTPSRQTDQTKAAMRMASQMRAAGSKGSSGERPEGDREQRRVAIERGFVGPDGLVVERQAGVEPRAGVVVRTDVRERVHRQVEDRVVDPDERPDDRGTDQGRADPAARGVAEGPGHAGHPTHRGTAPNPSKGHPG